MKIKILDKFSYQSFPITNDMIEIDDELLKQIGKTKCFDVEKQKVTDYDNSAEIKERQINNLRIQREKECFPIINRGQLWYSMLTAAQYTELQTWYQAWLDVTETLVIPEKPSWLE